MDVSVLRTTSFDNVDNFETLPYTEAILEKSIVAVPGHETCDQDALEAIKLDPAVLEAQVKVGTSSSEATTKSQSPASSVTSEHQGDVLRVGPRSSPSRRSSFEEMMRGTKAALFSLTPQQFDLLLQYVATLRQQRLGVQKCLECAFCKRNGESASWYSSHALKDGRGRIRCPVLRSYRCPRCGATGDNAHTIKYCQSYDD